MRVLWLCNIPVAAICEALQLEHAQGGGWMDGAFNDVMSNESIELDIFYPQNRTTEIEESQGKRFKGYGFPWPSQCDVNRTRLKELFTSILRERRPDCIHIFGTENEFGEIMADAATSVKMIDRFVVSIQGLVSVCSKQFLPDLPQGLLKRQTLSELKNQCSLWRQKESYRKRGESEIRLISKISHVIGRTIWDEGSCRLINPGISYHHVGESLRDEFYAIAPRRNCESHRIYFSQGQKPVKAMHRLVEAMPKVLSRYPDCEVVVAGTSRLRDNPITGLTYDCYLARMMDGLGVREHFKFIGTLDAKGVIGAMQDCSIFASCSSIENSPNSMGEAMMAGLPCVASFVGGVPDMVNHGTESLLYPFNETDALAYSIIRLFEDEDLADSLSVAGRARALINHSKSKNKKDLLATYKILASR